jgi:ABC-2 type transport system ATP-binding protein
MDPAIQTRDLCKRYAGRVALENLNLAVPAGSVFGFLGPNGAGKTTTLKLLVGLRRASGGEAWVMGHNVRREPRAARSLLGYLPESPAFYGWMSAAEYLRFAAHLFGLEGSELRLRQDYLLDLVGLRKARGPIRTFSRGMRQRLGIAQALINNPRVLLLDEPTSALDPIGRKEVLDTVASLRGGLTIFFSTHILADVERVADAVAILDQGRMLAQESMAELRRKHARRRMRLTVGSDPSELLARLRREPWLENVQRQEDDLLLHVKEIADAERRLPVLIAELGLPLRRLEVEELSLEEIFLEVLGRGN